MITVRIRSMFWFATGAALALVLALVLMHTWRADAAPGDTDTTFEPITPCRLIDTRPPPVRVGPHSTMGIADTRVVQATGTNGDCTIPNTAVGLSMNVTALNATELGFLTFWPGGAQPLAANLNPSPGEPPTPNAVTVPLSATGTFNVYNENGNVDIVIDVNGYYVTTSLRDLQTQIDAVNAGDSKVPAGTTVTGVEIWDTSVVKTTSSDDIAVLLPAHARVPLTDDKVNMAVFPGTLDGDPNCNGTFAVPTAPSGKVCIYPRLALNVEKMEGQAIFPVASHTDEGFRVRVFTPAAATAGADQYLQFSWAYHAP